MIPAEKVRKRQSVDYYLRNSFSAFKKLTDKLATYRCVINYYALGMYRWKKKKNVCEHMYTHTLVFLPSY